MEERDYRKILIAKARGITNSIEKMTESQKKDRPSGIYGDDYNSLCEEVESHLNKCQLGEAICLLPPKVTLFDWNEGKLCSQSYGEIHTFCQQIAQILTELQ
jgi:hypothetical protein